MAGCVRGRGKAGSPVKTNAPALRAGASSPAIAGEGCSAGYALTMQSVGQTDMQAGSVPAALHSSHLLASMT